MRERKREHNDDNNDHNEIDRERIHNEIMIE
jgi:hypothetical protein